MALGQFESKSTLTNLGNALTDFDLIKGLAHQTAKNAGAILDYPQDSFDHGNNAPTYLLVPGYGCNDGAMRDIGEQLKEEANVVYSQRGAYGLGDMDRSAELLNTKMLDILKGEESNGDLRIIGHSQGGLIGAKALTPGINQDGIKVNELNTLATPFLGAPLARIVAPLSRAAQQMNTPGGYVQDDIDPYVAKFRTFLTGRDAFIPPQYQQIPESLSSKVELQELDGTHTTFLFGKKAQEFTEALRAK